jgi:hypothetical protein
VDIKLKYDALPWVKIWYGVNGFMNCIQAPTGVNIYKFSKKNLFLTGIFI